MDNESGLGNLNDILNEEFMVVVVGNLIDNALEATEIKGNDEKKKVTLLLKETSDNIMIKVS